MHGLVPSVEILVVFLVGFIRPRCVIDEFLGGKFKSLWRQNINFSKTTDQFRFKSLPDLQARCA
jgi:hypothetical protein